jgi:tRNA(Ile)-lysidine synthase
LEENGADAYLTAHNAGDNAETVLLHLLRGSGLTGLSGMAEVAGRHWRPLLTVTRAEILDYLSAHRVPYREDGSNADTRFTRNKIRHQLMPVLREINPRAGEALNRLAVIAGRDDDCLNKMAAALVYDRGGITYCLKTELMRSHPALAARALRLLCPCDRQPPFGHVEAMLAAVTRSSAVELPGGLRMICRRGKVWVQM